MLRDLGLVADHRRPPRGHARRAEPRSRSEPDNRGMCGVLVVRGSRRAGPVALLRVLGVRGDLRRPPQHRLRDRVDETYLTGVESGEGARQYDVWGLQSLDGVSGRALRADGETPAGELGIDHHRRVERTVLAHGPRADFHAAASPEASPPGRAKLHDQWPASSPWIGVTTSRAPHGRRAQQGTGSSAPVPPRRRRSRVRPPGCMRLVADVAADLVAKPSSDLAQDGFAIRCARDWPRPPAGTDHPDQLEHRRPRLGMRWNASDTRAAPNESAGNGNAVGVGLGERERHRPPGFRHQFRHHRPSQVDAHQADAGLVHRQHDHDRSRPRSAARDPGRCSSPVRRRVTAATVGPGSPHVQLS